MTEYANMWKNYFNFGARTTVRGYWMAILFHFLAGLVISIVFTLILTDTAWVASMIFSVASLFPTLAMMVRRLRDAGKHWACIFLSLIPFVGIIILIVFLVKGSVPENGVPVV
ncbi:MAG: DUF805 domain-containing protein [Defluviitaleaceae bacterium]|nr:DUF805 domain-containing protein [Defluviitaleaceae bacterium]